MTRYVHNLKRFVQHQAKRADFQQMKYDFDRIECTINEKLVCNREICESLFYLESGLVRCNNFANNRTLWFETDNNFFTIPRSFLCQSPSAQELICMEESVIYTLTRTKLQQLCSTNLEWANWWSDILEKEFLKLEYIYQTLMYKSASERYKELIKAIPDIEARVSLKYIASFLGISQVSLSRIRAGKQ